MQKVDRSTYSIMVCFSSEVLQPAKLLSETFQNENVDMVDVVTYISQTKKQLERMERKDFESLPSVHCFLNSVKEQKEKHLFQDIKLKGFDNVKTIVSKDNDEFADEALEEL